MIKAQIVFEFGTDIIDRKFGLGGEPALSVKASRFVSKMCLNDVSLLSDSSCKSQKMDSRVFWIYITSV